jgi:hypothetical protein
VTEWNTVKWTEAGQILLLQGVTDEEAQVQNMPPAVHFETLRSAGRLPDAAYFLGHALPRYEGVVWAAQALRAMNGRRPPSPVQRDAMTAIMRWIDDPSDEHRRAAWDHGERLPNDCPEKLLISAIFLSGGSLSTPDMPAIQPPPHVSARLSAATVLTAAFSSEDPNLAFASAISIGESIAMNGLGS